MSFVRMDIQTLVVGGGPVASLIVLKSHSSSDHAPAQLPIRIGAVEAAAISMGIDDRLHNRPLTHDLLRNVIDALGANLDHVAIVDVQGTTFFAQLHLYLLDGRHVEVDCRPSDAIALAVRCGVPIYADESVLDTASVPDFKTVEEQETDRELELFHDFVESISPEDFI